MSDEDTKLWIYAGALPYELTEGDIVCVFSQYGEICEISLSRDKDTGKSRGFCFIKYEDDKSCELAVDNFHGTAILGRKIKVSHANNPNAVKSRRAANVAPQEGDNFIPKVLSVERSTRRDEQGQASSSGGDRFKNKDIIDEIEDGQLPRLALKDKRDTDEASPSERSRNRSNYKSISRTSDLSPKRKRRHQSDSPLPPIRRRSRSHTPSKPTERDRDRNRRSPERRHRHNRDRHRHHRSKSRSRSRSREDKRSRRDRTDSPRERSPREYRYSPRRDRDRHRHRSPRHNSRDRESRHRSSERRHCDDRHHRHRDNSRDRRDEPRRR